VTNGGGLADVVARALAEDLGARGDLTTTATVPADATARGALVARAAGVVAGVDAACAVFTAVDDRVAFSAALDAGAPVSPGSVIATVTGPTRALLTAERSALNLLGHLSGVATATRAYVDAVAGTGCVVRDTRKTLPGLRELEKAAVAAGGGRPHRGGLSDAVLVKDNHAVAAGGVGAAARLALEAAARAGVPAQVEVDDLDELEEALAAGVRAVLLDNFDLPDLRRAVARCRAHPEPVFVEASGGITLETVAEVAATGVDAVAVGAITHSAPALDVALDLVED